MLFPFRTDAPIYHWPIVTASVIVANILIFLADPSLESGWVEPFLLAFGKGLHPVQWISSLFFHLGPMHLIANMLWLYAFGLIVEGKLGWWKFLLAYLGIGAVESAVAQTLMLGSHGGYALGASGAIFGLMSMSLIWAPKNEVGCVLILWLVPHVFEISVLALASGYLAIELAFSVAFGFSMGSSLLHLLGGIAGLGLGIGLLVTKQVDCEGWDLFSVWKGKHIKLASQISDHTSRHERRSTEEPEGPQKLSHEAAQTQIREVLSAGQPLLALAAHRKLSQAEPGWQLPGELHLKLVSDLCGLAEWDHSVKLMKEYLDSHQKQAPLVRLKLAEVLLKQFERPAAALKVLARIPEGVLNARQEEFRRRLAARAEQLRREGAIELESEDF